MLSFDDSWPEDLAMPFFAIPGTYDFNEYFERCRERTDIVLLCHFTHFDNQIK